MIAGFREQVDFLLVYVGEAHPLDGWAFDNSRFQIKQHKTLEDRINAAKLLFKFNIPCQVLVDKMNDRCSKIFGAQPERLYIIKDGCVVYKGGIGPTFYNIGDARQWLQTHLQGK